MAELYGWRTEYHLRAESGLRGDYKGTIWGTYFLSLLNSKILCTCENSYKAIHQNK